MPTDHRLDPLPPNDSGLLTEPGEKKTLVPPTHHRSTVIESFSPATSNDGTVFPQDTEVVAEVQFRKVWIDDMLAEDGGQPA